MKRSSRLARNLLATAALAANLAVAQAGRQPAPQANPAPKLVVAPKTIAVNGLAMTGVVFEPKVIPVDGLKMTGDVFVPKTIPVNGLTMTGLPPGAAGTPRR